MVSGSKSVQTTTLAMHLAREHYQNERPGSAGANSQNYVIEISGGAVGDNGELDGNVTRSNDLNEEASDLEGDACRICQQHSDEAVLALGCQCRGGLAGAHRTCMERWFGSNRTNKCEICQQVATNVPADVLLAQTQTQEVRTGGEADIHVYHGIMSWRGSTHIQPWLVTLIILTVLFFLQGITVIIFRRPVLTSNIISIVLVIAGFAAVAGLILSICYRHLRRSLNTLLAWMISLHVEGGQNRNESQREQRNDFEV